MNIKLLRCRKNEGSVLVVALLISVVATFGMLAMVTVVNTRSTQTQAMEDGIQRRLSMQNGRNLANLYVRENMVSGLINAVDIDLPDWGLAKVSGLSVNPLNTLQTLGLHNQMGPAGIGGFGQIVNVELNDGYTDYDFNYVLRSRSPMLSGDLLTLHLPVDDPTLTSQVMGNVSVNGRTRLWGDGSANYVAVKTQAFVEEGGVFSGITDLAGAELLEENYGQVVASGGTSAGGYLGYQGRLDVINNSETPENSLYHKIMASGAATVVDGNVETNLAGVICDAGGRVYIDLNSPTLSNVVIGDHVEEITIIGQRIPPEFWAADDMSMVTVLLDESASSSRALTNIIFQHSNNRRMILAVKRENNLGAYTNFIVESKPWRGFFYTENTRAQVIVGGGGTFTLTGGLQTDSRLNIAAGQLAISEETDPIQLENFAPRYTWLETYRQ